jgi:hypothetical protein
MSKLIPHLFHDHAASLSTLPALAERMHQVQNGSDAALRVYIVGPAEGALVPQIDSLVKQGVRLTTYIGLAQKSGSEAAFRARGITLESAALGFADEAATAISF